MSGIARYDGLAEWYRDWSLGSDTIYRDSTECLTEMLGAGPGRDMDDLAAVFGESARVLRPGGTLVHVGSHPCFCSPVAVPAEEDRMVLHRGYSDTRWRTSGPAIGDGIRRRAGVRHVPLAELLNAIAGAGLVLVAAREANGDDFPRLLVLHAERPF